MVQPSVPVGSRLDAVDFDQTFQDPMQGELERWLKRKETTQVIDGSPLAEVIDHVQPASQIDS